MQHHLFAWQPQSIIGQVQFFLRLNETIESFWAIPKLHLVARATPLQSGAGGV